MAGMNRTCIADHCVDLYVEWDIRRGRFVWSAPETGFLGYNVRRLSPCEEWWTARVHPDDLDRLVEGLGRLVDEEENSWSAVFRLRRFGGGYASVLGKFFVAERDGGGVVSGGLSVLPLEAEAVGERPPSPGIDEHMLFATMASHELKEPVRTLDVFFRLFSHSLDKDGLSDGQREVSGHLRDAIGRLKMLVTGLARYGCATPYAPKLEVLDFNGLVSDVVGSLRRRICERGVEVRNVGGIGNVLLDRFLAHTILQNLLLNAIKYNASERPVVTIDSRNSGTDIVFSVTDNGMGIEEKYQKLIFEPFHRINPNKGAKGSGLGLYAALRAAEKMNGSIRCYSEVGVGSTFEVRLFEQNIVDARR